MYYYNHFRSEDPQEFDNLNDEYGTQAMDTTFFCPYYRQFFLPPSDDFMSRQPDGRPPFGQQPGQQFGPPFGQQPGQQSGPPMGPPPSVTPSKQSPMVKSAHGTFAVDPGAIRPCLFRYVYIWPRRGRPFWAWLTFIGRRSVSGFRWDGRRWRFFGMELRQIESFICY